MIAMFTCTARSLFRTEDSIATSLGEGIGQRPGGYLACQPVLLLQIAIAKNRAPLV